MRRSLVRSVSVLALVLVLSLLSVSAPASAGQLGGAGGDEITSTLEFASKGDCAFTQNSVTGTFFVGIVTGSTNTGLVNGIKIVRVPGNLPDQFSNHCTPLPPFTPAP